MEVVPSCILRAEVGAWGAAPDPDPPWLEDDPVGVGVPPLEVNIGGEPLESSPNIVITFVEVPEKWHSSNVVHGSIVFMTQSSV